MTKLTLLDKVRSKMATFRGEALRTLAAEAGMSYDTALRIRDAQVDPPFSKVQKLAEHLKLVPR